MSDVKNQLDALLANKGVMRGADWKEKVKAVAAERDAGTFEIDKTIPGELVSDGDYGFYLVRQDFPLDTEMGGFPLGAALDTQARHIALAAADEELQDFDPRTALFIDTETSGLAGGAGTVVFLTGVGYFTDDAFRLDQCFMRDYDDEESMLEFLADRFKQCESVVSYNGKTFDMPLLRTRFIQNRIPYRLDSVLHFDLLHSARRFWKRRLGNCSLGNIEREVLGIHREGDVPGHLIPQLWFDYLRTRDARPLKGVFYHHETDILSLVALMGRLSATLDEPDGSGFEHDEDRLSLVRVHFRQKQYEEVITLGERFLETEAETYVRHECLTMMGFAFKRRERFGEMARCWSTMLEEFPRDVTARHELAKHHEHRSRDLVEAERLCEEAVKQLESRGTLGRSLGTESPELAHFQKRLDRIRGKLAKGLR